MTALKTRIVALRQQMVRVDRERREPITTRQTEQLLKRVERHLTSKVSAVILCDYGKGVVTQELLDSLTVMCRQRGIWLSMDPKPVKPLHLKGLSLMTPNRKEALALARRPEVPGTGGSSQGSGAPRGDCPADDRSRPCDDAGHFGRERHVKFCQRGRNLSTFPPWLGKSTMSLGLETRPLRPSHLPFQGEPRQWRPPYLPITLRVWWWVKAGLPLTVCVNVAELSEGPWVIWPGPFFWIGIARSTSRSTI